MSVEWLGEDRPSHGVPEPRAVPRQGRRLAPRSTVTLMLTLVVGLGVGFAIGRATATSQVKPAPAALTVVRGQVLIPGYVGIGSAGIGSSCISNGRYDDIQSAAPILISDTTPHIVGAARLGPGRITANGCAFPFSVSMVATSAEYLVSVVNRAPIVVGRAHLANVLISYTHDH